MTAEYTEHDSPRSYAFRVLDGPVRALGKGSFEPLGEGDRTRFTFEGYGDKISVTESEDIIKSLLRMLNRAGLVVEAIEPRERRAMSRVIRSQRQP